MYRLPWPSVFIYTCHCIIIYACLRFSFTPAIASSFTPAFGFHLHLPLFSFTPAAATAAARRTLAHWW
jgi:hypothetical protein